jgi:acylphosphatase
MSGRRLRIFGEVQGVCFRAWTARHARALGVRGWVRNRRDGSVELEAYGPAEAMDALVALCREGPPAARVERTEVEAVEAEGPEGFEIAATF